MPDASGGNGTSGDWKLISDVFWQQGLRLSFLQISVYGLTQPVARLRLTVPVLKAPKPDLNSAEAERGLNLAHRPKLRETQERTMSQRK